MKNKKDIFQYNLMMVPAVILLFIFSIIPMFGIVMAFQDYVPAKGFFGSEWVGLKHFEFMFQMPDSRDIFANTIIIATLKIVVGQIASLIMALLLNEVRVRWFKKTVQTIVYLPYFLSWVILSGIILNIFSLDGVINQVISFFGGEKIMFMADNNWFRFVLILTEVWKNCGFNTIVFLAALTGISPALYEAAAIDGASRGKLLWHITLPGLKSTIVLLVTLSLGNILNAGFDQIYNLYNPLVYETADIIDTYVYRAGLIGMQYSLGTAVGLLKSVVSFILISVSYRLAYRYADYRIF